ncbi:TetR/AcrR family transcriptional regulator [Nocardia sp. alder85J]|uniref:TetR/AcrR family transcriptional regulator n=1 Tax=Nocardia sp. alder85J TaxID=2862949 RepID=UPI001CD35A09|nr:TetR/AcrR family transcriptional regulator [Nocardia sp. alder85J]MCX4095891.1 helix-turn-helix domain containing protein [Nocardia sp. alder85J]
MLRADAARNRELVMAAAGAELAEHGPDVSVARIAQRAGVAKGTVFNHFANKDELVAAVIADRLDAMTALGADLRERADPETALAQFLTAVAELQMVDKSYCEVTGAVRGHPVVRAATERLTAVIEALAAGARAADALRADVTSGDIVLLLGAAVQIAAPVAGTRPDLWRRYLALLLDGLRPVGTGPLPAAPPQPHDFTQP